MYIICAGYETRHSASDAELTNPSLKSAANSARYSSYLLPGICTAAAPWRNKGIAARLLTHQGGNFSIVVTGGSHLQEEVPRVIGPPARRQRELNESLGIRPGRGSHAPNLWPPQPQRREGQAHEHREACDGDQRNSRCRRPPQEACRRALRGPRRRLGRLQEAPTHVYREGGGSRRRRPGAARPRPCHEVGDAFDSLLAVHAVGQMATAVQGPEGEVRASRCHLTQELTLLDGFRLDRSYLEVIRPVSSVGLVATCELFPQDAERLLLVLVEPTPRRSRNEEQAARLRHREGVLDVAMSGWLPIREVRALGDPLTSGLTSSHGLLHGEGMTRHIHGLEGYVLLAARHCLEHVHRVHLGPKAVAAVRRFRVLRRVEPRLELLAVRMPMPVLLQHTVVGHLRSCLVDPPDLVGQLLLSQLGTTLHLLLQLVQ
mmetsp:Transcript_128328/g.332741  ORF Transcript_128328/g.332741 Transcript_128328/m.332741 type:complete len:431 (+) Transcript_128328:2-1294(+)